MQPDKNKKRKTDPTPLSTRLAMAAVGILVVCAFFYFFGGADFPMMISFEKLR